MTEHQIHERLPNGFHFADALQAKSFAETGSINGASKVALVRRDHGKTFVACRLRPPRTWGDVVSPSARGEAGRTGFIDRPDNREARDWYVSEYNAGWAAARRGTDDGPFQRGISSMAYDDGYLDLVAGRMKWHLTYCANHDNNDTGCQEA